MARITQRYATTIGCEDLADILKDFSNLVYDGKAKKMNYQTWREMSVCVEDEMSLYDIEWERDEYYDVCIDIIYDNHTSWVFHTGDNSFGDFIYENLLRGRENNEMSEYYTLTDSGSRYYDDYRSYYADSTSSALATKADVCELNRIDDTVSKLCESAALAAPMKNNNKTEKKKENFAMKFNFDFGPVNSSMVRMSLYGLAVKNKAGTWVSYDAKAGDIMDVDILNFDGAKFLYKMPVAIKDIAIGDVVIHNGIPMFVIAIATSGAYITAVDPINGERKDIMLPKSPFGFNFATKVVNFLGNAFNTVATAENPFGNMWMLMAMSGENKDMNDILPFLMLNNATPGIDNNVLMFMALSNNKDGSKDNILPMLMMMNAQHPVPNVPSQGCTCGGNCTDNHTQG